MIRMAMALAAMAMAACSGTQAQPVPAVETRVFVMRHLHTAGGPDPALTPDGERGAAALARQLKDAGVTSIHVTDTRRSRQTAAPLATALGIEPSVYDPRDPGALIAGLAGKRGAALIVGHSNTVPDLIARLGGTPPPPLGHDDFGTLWLVEPDGATRSLDAGGAAPARSK